MLLVLSLLLIHFGFRIVFFMELSLNPVIRKRDKRDTNHLNQEYPFLEQGKNRKKRITNERLQPFSNTSPPSFPT